ncbi:uncharacterized protein BDV17DRAFT_254545 [Aspergillus undulatus]|uniref:uncharacterized protein n=1 Tax=Aspergillus undulatus TaxID=1810928 RepID=UPI003CCCF782
MLGSCTLHTDCRRIRRRQGYNNPTPFHSCQAHLRPEYLRSRPLQQQTTQSTRKIPSPPSHQHRHFSRHLIRIPERTTETTASLAHPPPQNHVQASPKHPKPTPLPANTHKVHTSGLDTPSPRS